MTDAGGRMGCQSLARDARLEHVESLAHYRDAWSELAPSTKNIFATWEWADSWRRHLAPERRVLIAAVRRGDQTVAILPLDLRRHFGISIARLVGHELADQLQPVCKPADLPLATDALAKLLSPRRILLAERLPPLQDWAGDLGGRVINHDASPVIGLAAEGGWEAYLERRSRNFRQQVRRRARRLQRQLGVSFKLVTDPVDLPRAFDALLTLHSARWHESSRAFVGARERFHYEFAERALDRGWLRLWLAEAEGTPVAAWYGFRFAGVESFYQAGRDPAWDRFAIGAGILEHSIREAFADGMDEYRLLRGAEAYKSRYATFDPGLVTVAAAQGVGGRALVGAVDGLSASLPGRGLVKWLSRL
jgi:CelD/BcsL family acetyltransferase involved in cellulose biosynthesis